MVTNKTNNELFWSCVLGITIGGIIVSFFVGIASAIATWIGLFGGILLFWQRTKSYIKDNVNE